MIYESRRDHVLLGRTRRHGALTSRDEMLFFRARRTLRFVILPTTCRPVQSIQRQHARHGAAPDHVGEPKLHLNKQL
jgi:hypothetical protein